MMKVPTLAPILLPTLVNSLQLSTGSNVDESFTTYSTCSTLILNSGATALVWPGYENVRKLSCKLSLANIDQLVDLGISMILTPTLTFPKYCR
jgi:hypothetical protein